MPQSNSKRKADELDSIPLPAVLVHHNGNNNGNANSGNSGNNSIGNNHSSNDSIIFDDSEQQTIRITARKNEFNKEHFWLVDLYAEPSLKQGATPLVRRCMKFYGWDELYCRRVLKAYRQFLIIKEKKKDWNAVLLLPSVDVNEMWHQHILDVNNYIHDCMLLCGHVLGHNPDTKISDEKEVTSKKNDSRYTRTKMALEEYFDDQEIDKTKDGVWKEVFHREPNHQYNNGKSSRCSTPVSSTTNAAPNVRMDASFSNSPNSTSRDNITILFRNEVTGVESHFNMKISTSFGLVFESYAQRHQTNISMIRFVYQNVTIEPNETPQTLLELVSRNVGNRTDSIPGDRWNANAVDDDVNVNDSEDSSEPVAESSHGRQLAGNHGNIPQPMIISVFEM
jgi:hypothetical protein